MDKFTLKKVFMSKDIPPDVLYRVKNLFNSQGLGSGNNDDLLIDWLILNGAEPKEIVIIDYQI